MNIVNLTQHPINIFDNDCNPLLVVEPSGTLARVDSKSQNAGFIEANKTAIPLSLVNFSEKVVGLPQEISNNTAYIVSLITYLQITPRRSDVYIIGEAIRNEKGHTIGCIGLSQM